MSTYRITMREETSLDEFRQHVRALIPARVKPADIEWRTARAEDLFGGAPPPPAARSTFTVPSGYLELATDVLRHRDPQRFALLYTLLWRIVTEDRKLLAIVSDPLVFRLRQMQKSVNRDLHKMTAFVRFRQMKDADGEHFVAWFEPQHLILQPAAEFFQKRFANMIWSILTPDGALHWDGRTLTYGPGVPKSQAPDGDDLEAWWLTYYRATFNPARANPKMLRTEMPARYWKNLPEAALIPDLLAGADARAHRMIEATPTSPRRVAVRAEPQIAVAPDSLQALAAEARDCRRCPLYGHATQTVFGEGPADAPVVFVGEQPGDQEDLVGQPFVGPAGQVFDRALAEANLDRSRVYVTNAVKHFKFVPRGKKRIHQKPNGYEIDHCRWWVEREIETIAPKLVVALGATAARSLTGKEVKITQMRGQTITMRGGLRLLITVHPSYLLRLPDADAQRAEYQKFVADLVQVGAVLPAVRSAA